MVIFDDPCHDGEGPGTPSHLLIVWEEGALEDHYEIIQGDSDGLHDFAVYWPFDDGKEQLHCFLLETIQKLKLITYKAFDLKLTLSTSLGYEITAVINDLGGD